MLRWVRVEMARYSQALLVKELFGEWILIMLWGAPGSKPGGMRRTLAPMYVAGLERIGQIEKRRKRHRNRSLSSA